MPDDEGLALYDAGARRGRTRPAARDRLLLRQVRGVPRRGGPSRRDGAVHRRPSPWLGGEPSRVGTPRPRARRPRDRPHGHAAVLPAHDRDAPSSKTSSSRSSGTPRRSRRRGARRSGCCSSTAATTFDVALADYEGWARNVVPGGLLVFHDVFEDPADGGQAPFEVWKHAVADGFTPVSTTGSLRAPRA